MKKFILAVITILVITISNAQVRLEVDQYGKYRLKEDAFRSVEITAEQGAVKFIHSFDVAISNPYEFIPLETHKKTIKMTGLYKALKIVEETGIIYREEDEQIYLFKKDLPAAEENSCLLLFAVLSVVIMVISNIFKQSKISLNELVLVITILSSLVTACVSLFVPFFVSIIAILCILVSSRYAKSKLYKPALVGYYLSMIAYFILMFIEI